MACGGCGGRNAPKKIEVPVVAPTLHADGTIEFPEGPAPGVIGYTMDPDDDRVLIPSGLLPCVMRITGIMMQKDGSYAPIHVCRHPKCEHRTGEVTPDICADCPLRTMEEV